MFDEGVRLLQQNKDAEALEKFKAAIAANPSMEEAYKLWKETDNRVWSSMMVKNDEFAKVARHMLRLAQLERKRATEDADAIKALVEKALSDSYEDRVSAALKLMSDHGDYAVPHLLDALGDADADAKQSYAILTCEQIGRPATLPLLAALASDNALLRRNVAVALMYIGDDRAVPSLKRLAENDGDAAVREVAQKAVAKLAAGTSVGSSTSLFLAQSDMFLKGRGIREGDIQDGIWSFEDGKLVNRKVPALVFPLELAKQAAYRALDTDPNNEAALIAVTRAYVAENAVVASAAKGGAGDEAIQNLKASADEMGITVLAAGPDVVRKAFRANVADGMVPAAVSSLQTLAKLEDPKNLAGSPLLESLGNGDKRIRYGAAIALSSMNAALSQSQRTALVGVLGQAVLEETTRVAHAIDPNNDNATVYREAAQNTPGLMIPVDAKTTSGLAEIARFAPDVLIVNEKLDTFLVDDILRFVGDRQALTNTKIILVSKDKNGAQEIYGEKIHGYIAAPVTEASLKNRIDEVLKGVEMAPGRAEADKVASSAAEAIAKLDPTSYPVADASAQLIVAAGRKDAVATASLAALGNAAAPSSLVSIVKVMNGAKDRAGVCAAAAEACGRIMARAGSADGATVDALVALASDKSLDAKIRGAAAAALGRAPILPGTRAKLFRDLRVDPGKSGDEGQ